MSAIVSMAASLFSPLLRAVRAVRSLLYNNSGETQNDDSDYDSENSPVSDPESDNSPVSEPPEQEVPAMSSSTSPLGPDPGAEKAKTPLPKETPPSALPKKKPPPPPKEDLLASGQGRTLILFVAANDKKMASVLFVEMDHSNFHIIINHSTKDLPFALQRPGACQTQRELQALKAAILENKEFLKDRPFRFLAPSIPLFLYLLNGKKEALEFLNGQQFTLGFLGKERSHLPDILSEDNIFTRTEPKFFTEV